ncbi:MAG: type II toxin-antitoxin system HicA family toxin [Deltaproteobacteria bacterium]|nr:type II toxin-antitoxin system HicA family toxin [Deltaproteobacteria bacterium]
MSAWPATKAKRVLAALERIGWKIKRTAKTSGSHRTLSRTGKMPVPPRTFQDSYS